MAGNRRLQRYNFQRALAPVTAGGALGYFVKKGGQWVQQYMADSAYNTRNNSPVKRRKRAFFRPRLTRRAGIYNSYHRKRSRRLTIADKALKNIGFQRAYWQTSGRASSNNGKQAMRLISTGLDDAKMFKAIKSVNPAFNPSLRSYVAHFKTITKNIMITNATNNQTVVYVYEMMAKKDLTEDLKETADEADDMLADGDTTPFTEENIQYVPTSAPMVYTNFQKACRVHYRVMDPGAVWNIKIVTNPNRRFNTTNMANSVAGTEIVKLHRGITSQTLVRFHGTPASRSNQEGTVTITPSRLEWTCSETYSFKHVDNMQNETELMQGFSTEAGDFDIINDETGEKTTNQTA